jgi:hypothetical protein
MFRSPFALALLVALVALTALAGTAAATPPPFTTDTLAPGGGTAQAAPFVTDTLAPGGAPAPAARFVTDTLAPGGGSGSTTVVAPGRDGFAWGDAGAGAGTVALIAFLLAAALRGRRRAVPA